MLLLGSIVLWLSTTTIADPIFVIKADDIADNYGGYRLPKTQIPSTYKISLTLTSSVFTGSETSFDGTVEITFSVTEQTETLQIHAPVNISSIQLGAEEIAVDKVLLNSTTEIATIPLNAALTVDTNYNLTIHYVGQLDIRNMTGFYRSSYDNADGIVEYLVTTQFQPTHARKAFPCFDEPQFKARFTVSITYPKGYNALSNTPQDGIPVTINNTYETATFKETPVMSTYLMAFIVSKFTCTLGENIDTNIPYQVCSRNEATSDRALAVEYGPLFIKALENVTAIKYSEQNIGKMDQAAIPDFDAGAMENWGLVTYRERALLWNANESSNTFKQSILETVAHELTHMWFGNLVTCEWWDYTFLNEGFARFFQFFALSMVPQMDNFEMEKQFIVNQQQTAFLADSSTTSPALTSKAASPSEVSGKFNTIAYNKGAAIFRMAQNFMGSENFYNGIRSYLKIKANSPAVPEELWSALQPFAIGVNLSQVMNNWINQAGFPLVTVSSIGNDIILSQKRFLYSGTDAAQWYIPISYTVSNDTNKFVSVNPNIWLNPGENVTLHNVLQDNEWIILNNKESAYYRVNYDSNLWTKIQAALHTDHNQIDVLNRAQIVDDSLNLARAGILKYTEVFGILNYLKNETEYYPWSAALSGLNFLTVNLGEGSEVEKRVNSLLLEWMENVYNSVSFTKLDETDQIYTLKLILALTRACKLGKPECVASAKNLFKSLKDQGTSVDKNLKTIVYCNGLRFSDDIESDWTFLWNKFQNSTLSTEQVTIISTLGCTKNITILKKYLELSLNESSGIRVQDLTSVWASVYSSNTEGVDVAMDYLQENHQKIHLYYPGAASLISGIAARFTTEEQVKKLEEFIAMETLHSSLKSAGTSAITAAKANIQWTSTVKRDLEEYFNIDNDVSTVKPSGAPAVSPPVFIVVGVLLVIVEACFR